MAGLGVSHAEGQFEAGGVRQLLPLLLFNLHKVTICKNCTLSKSTPQLPYFPSYLLLKLPFVKTSEKLYFVDSETHTHPSNNLKDQVEGACITPALYLAAGYPQIPIPEQGCDRTAFFGESEVWEFAVMPFRLCNALGVFAAVLTRILEKYVPASFLHISINLDI